MIDLLVYLAGAAAVATFCGWKGVPVEELFLLVVFWPIVAFVILLIGAVTAAASPFYGLYLLGHWLSTRSYPWTRRS